MLNPRLETLSDYPFRRLATLLAPIAPPSGRIPVDLALGQPMHPIPPLMIETLRANEHLWGRYPPVNGTPAFREATAAWLTRRYHLPAGILDPDRHLLPVAGTKEALFMIAQAVMPERKAGQRPAVLLPNPFYNVYLGGALMAGAEPVLLSVTAETSYLPRLDQLSGELLERTAAFYLCSPANPQGAAADLDYLKRLIELARVHRFLLIVDECYAEIYTETPPPGALEAAIALDGRLDSLLVCHSLSKRSSAAGLRSGFVAGDPEVLAGFVRLRSYAAAVQPLPVLAAATALWQDEEHVIANRELYREKFDLTDDRLGRRFGYYRPDGGFFLWLEVGDGEAAARRLWAEAAIKVLPGGYIGRPDPGGDNPGDSAIRVALVHDLATVEGALTDLVATLS
ncbi:MAG TPA: aminotransferase class I/II-fold pyridoxal phosphate-dependent enzyme [Geminicoccaceae bacterium]|nr:aminotransferase class I/II-fold pyridoxal phosphate-dependent enzyme [Geminicoccaceae bacterium]